MTLKRIITLLVLTIFLMIPLLGSTSGEEKEKTTQAYEETGEPEGDSFHIPPFPVDQKVFDLQNPGLSRLAGRISSGEANLIEWREWSYWFPRLYPFEKPFSPDWRLKAKERIRDLRPNKVAGRGAVSWTYLGPDAYYDGSDISSGRATAVWADPSDKNHILLGTADGGVWETTDQGSTWTSIFDSADSLSIGAIAVDPTDTKVIYVGTGEGNFNGDMIAGLGMYKSLDGGQNWTLLNLPPWTYALSYHNIRRIAVDPRFPNHVYAAVDGGLIYSTDGGTNWSVSRCGTSSGPWLATDVVLVEPAGPADPYIVFVAFGYVGGSTDNGIFRSTVGGSGPWTEITSGGGFPSSDVGRITLLSAPSDPKQMYALVSSRGGGMNGIFYTQDCTASSVSWSSKSTYNFCSAQCWYDMTGAVDPSNPSKIMVGGLDVYLSTDNGKNLSRKSDWAGSGNQFSHADHHHMAMPDSNTLYDANDGGLFIGTVSGTSISWENRNAELPTLQFYGFAQHPTDPTKFMGGLQDNGQALTDGSTWNEVAGGDGGKSAWDYDNPNYGYEEYVYGFISRNSNIGSNPYSWECIRNFGGCGCSYSCVPDGRTAFIAPFVLDANDPNTMYTGSWYMYANTDVRSGKGWSKLSTTDFTYGDSNAYLYAIHSAKNGGTPGTIWAGTTNGKVSVTTDGGTTWTDRSSGLTNATVTSITTDPQDGSKVLVTFSGYGSNHIYRSTNGGASWTNITGGLPFIPFNSIALDPSDSNHAYAGSDFGVYENTSVWTSSSWTSIQGNLPAVSVQEMGFNVSTGALRVATHGRGIWEKSANPQPTVSSVTPLSGPPAGGTSVVVSGTNLSGATEVMFGDTAADSFTVDSDDQITAVSPAHADGAVDITVTTPYGTSPVVPENDTFIFAPECSSFSISPGSASPTASSGDTDVAINGSPSGCMRGAWTAVANDAWLHVSTGAGEGPSSVTVSWDANSGTSRSGSVAIAGNTFSVTQNSDSEPPTVSVTSPTCGSTVYDSAVTYYWAGSDNVTASGNITYSYNFDSTGWSSYSSSTSHTFNGLIDGIHTLELLAKDESGNISSPITTCSVTADIPDYYPDSSAPSFSWTDSGDSKWRIEFSSASDFSDLAVTSDKRTKKWLEASPWTPGGKKWAKILNLAAEQTSANTIVYWRAVGKEIGVSETHSFKISLPLPAQPSNPSDGTSITASTPATFTWSLNHNKKVQVEFSSTSDFSSGVEVSSKKNRPGKRWIKDTTWTASSGKWDKITALGTTVYWRIYAKDSLGRETYSDVQSFTLTN